MPPTLSPRLCPGGGLRMDGSVFLMMSSSSCCLLSSSNASDPSRLTRPPASLMTSAADWRGSRSAVWPHSASSAAADVTAAKAAAASSTLLLAAPSCSCWAATSSACFSASLFALSRSRCSSRRLCILASSSAAAAASASALARTSSSNLCCSALCRSNSAAAFSCASRSARSASATLAARCASASASFAAAAAAAAASASSRCFCASASLAFSSSNFRCSSASSCLSFSRRSSSSRLALAAAISASVCFGGGTGEDGTLPANASMTAFRSASWACWGAADTGVAMAVMSTASSPPQSLEAAAPGPPFLAFTSSMTATCAFLVRFLRFFFTGACPVGVAAGYFACPGSSCRTAQSKFGSSRARSKSMSFSEETSDSSMEVSSWLAISA
mmetsp:Transcript_17510/g.67927  ORF Transcript_17510/g.67927 Transcript_17510/m.67927 type:complete len:388 (+) Transcript_17510:1208-2371(+)